MFKKKELTRQDVASRIVSHIIEVDTEKKYPGVGAHWYTNEELIDLLTNSPEYKRIMYDLK